MTYKLCQRCQFLVPDKKKLCPTCGCNKFAELRQNGKHVTAVPIEAPSQAARTQLPAGTPAKAIEPSVLPQSMPTGSITAFPELQASVAPLRQNPASGTSSLRQKFSMSDEEASSVRLQETIDRFKRVFGVGDKI